MIAASALALFAHVGLGPHLDLGFGAGFVHPFSGLDHLLAMVAVGLWAAQHKDTRRLATFAVPAAFVAAMLLGAGLAWSGILLPGVELGITTSVVVFGLLIASAVRAPLALGVLLAGLAGLSHGHAHGGEVPAFAASAAGFVVATALLHGAGLTIGTLARGAGLRVLGGAIALTGVGLAVAASV